MVENIKYNGFKLKSFAALCGEKNRDGIAECTTRIMNTPSFRKLAGKTQVILSMSGPDVRTRLTHTIEVAKIAKDICIKLGLKADLAEAMSLAHDIGHTPFGHVGERTLTEIMCGCDTLGEKIRDCDFINSGFKHNLQTFRVLNDLECVNGNGKYKKIWDLIFWGATAHTKMTYAKTILRMDDEILISAKHCPWVYVCHYHERKECKRNIQNKKVKNDQNKGEICKPWYCAKLPIMNMKSKDQVKEEWLRNGESTRDYLKREPIEEKYWGKIFCSHKCYLSKLWEYKIDYPAVYKKYPYLFDHPFPNTFYTNSIAKYFEDKEDYISFESLIVHQSDEIAQRQQDLEDGINKSLLTFDDAKQQVLDLIENFEDPDFYRNELSDLELSKNSEDLGKVLADFYKKVIINQTRQNFVDFQQNQKIVDINIYSLITILNSLYEKKERKNKWILEEFKQIHNPRNFEGENYLESYFKISCNPIYLILLSFDHLERCTKQDKYHKDILTILSECIRILSYDLRKQNSDQKKKLLKLKYDKDLLWKTHFQIQFFQNDNLTEPELDFKYRFLKTIDLLRDYLSDFYDMESKDFFKKENKGWKTIGCLQLSSFYALIKIFTVHKTKDTDTICISDLKNLNVQEEYNPAEHATETFKIWKRTLCGEANQVLSNIVNFIDQSNEKHTKRKKAMNNFESTQRNTILKSEIVEKNDGKASYIIRRLFKAYITNSHQLPDSGLKYIIASILDDDFWKKFLDSEKKAVGNILDKLKKTMIINTTNTKLLKEISKNTLIEFQTEDNEFKRLMNGKSNEIKAALEKRKELSEYFKKLKNVRGEIKEKINSENEKDKNYINKHLRNLRAILDNSILNAIYFWETILTRAICDYIASLTDQEAVNEYEKLYAGIMELA